MPGLVETGTGASAVDSLILRQLMRSHGSLLPLVSPVVSLEGSPSPPRDSGLFADAEGDAGGSWWLVQLMCLRWKGDGAEGKTCC